MPEKKKIAFDIYMCILLSMHMRYNNNNKSYSMYIFVDIEKERVKNSFLEIIDFIAYIIIKDYYDSGIKKWNVNSFWTCWIILEEFENRMENVEFCSQSLNNYKFISPISEIRLTISINHE